MKFNLQNDSRIGEAVSCLLTLVALNIVWFVCSLPVVTAGASTAALHSGLRKYANREDGAVKEFFADFKQNFKSSTAVWLLAVIMLLCIIMCFTIVSGFDGIIKKLGFAFFCLPSMIEASVMVYVFPLISRFKLKFKDAVVNALMLAIAYFPRTLLIIFLNAIPFLIFIFFPSALVCLLFIWIPVGVSVTALAIDGILEPIFSELEER